MPSPIRFYTLILCGTLIITACKNNEDADGAEPANKVTTDAMPASMSWQMVNSYPHDTLAYTQGLEWHNNGFLEGTGQLGESNVRLTNLTDGKVLKQVPNSAEIFGEGITRLGDKIYQLTWQNKKVFVYDATTLTRLAEIPLNTEGWGLTNNGSELIVSDGSSNLYFYEPESFKELRRVGVTDHLGPKGNINELEYVNGFIYANIWQSNYIVKIDPATGKIIAQADLSRLVNEAGLQPNYTSQHSPEVMNGIAYDSVGQRFFITGKYWPKVFEIKLN